MEYTLNRHRSAMESQRLRPGTKPSIRMCRAATSSIRKASPHEIEKRDNWKDTLLELAVCPTLRLSGHVFHLRPRMGQHKRCYVQCLGG
jgi:hypothetical protein